MGGKLSTPYTPRCDKGRAGGGAGNTAKKNLRYCRCEKLTFHLDFTVTYVPNNLKLCYVKSIFFVSFSFLLKVGKKYAFCFLFLIHKCTYIKIIIIIIIKLSKLSNIIHLNLPVFTIWF